MKKKSEAQTQALPNPKGVTIMVDSATAQGLIEIRQECIAKLKAAGLPEDLAPTVGFIARDMLRKAMAMKGEAAAAFNREVDGIAY